MDEQPVGTGPHLRPGTLKVVTVASVVIIAVVTTVALTRILSMRRQAIGDALETVLATTQQATRSWVGNQLSGVEVWATNPDLVAMVERLDRLPRDSASLAGTPVQDELRDFLRPVLDAFGYQGFFVIAMDSVNLGSTRDSNLGVRNLLDAAEGFLDRLYAGETLLSPPVRSDVPLPDSTGTLRPGLPTMFVGAPIRDAGGATIALLTFRLDPERDFTRIFQRGRIGQSGETYAFDSRTRMISNSRFDDQLRVIGLIGEGEHAILNVETRDPGANLIDGDAPTGERPPTVMAASALAGLSGRNADGYRDYRGVPVVGAWLWDDQLGFGITTEQDVSEASSRSR